MVARIDSFGLEDGSRGKDPETEREREISEWLSWALDVLDMYDERLAEIDGADLVYSPVHIAGKAKARAVLGSGGK